MKKTKIRVCGMCLSYSNNWCTGCGSVIVAPIAQKDPTLTGIPRKITDPACAQFTSRGFIDHWNIIENTKSNQDGK